jgi:hypothetical protein
VKPTPTTEEVFTPDELAAADARDLVYLLSSRAYSDFFVPLLTGLMQRSISQLCDRSISRREHQTDDYLRGYIAAARAILNAPQTILEEQEQRNREEVIQDSVSKRYEEIAHGGRGPYGEDQAGISPTDPI